MLYQVYVKTHKHSEIIDITELTAEKVHESGIVDGVCTVYTPHTTAALTVNENSDSDVLSDLLVTLDSLVPWDKEYSHIGGNSAAHIKSSLVGCSVQIIVSSGRLLLGTWQAIYFCEFDGGRNRKIYINIS